MMVTKKKKQTTNQQKFPNKQKPTSIYKDDSANSKIILDKQFLPISNRRFTLLSTSAPAVVFPSEISTAASSLSVRNVKNTNE